MGKKIFRYTIIVIIIIIIDIHNRRPWWSTRDLTYFNRLLNTFIRWEDNILYTMHIVMCTKMHFTHLYYVNINSGHTRFDPTMASVLKMLNKRRTCLSTRRVDFRCRRNKSDVKIIKEKNIQDQISKGRYSSLDIVN